MGRYDDQIDLLRYRNLSDFVGWGAHNHLVSNLDLGSFGRRQYLCEIKMALAFQILQDPGRPSRRYKAYIRRELFDDME
jgi:hypothetical protein